MFDSVHPKLTNKPTLSDLLGAIRSRRKDGLDLYQSHIFLKLISDSALQQNSSFLNLMNESHHGRDINITFTEVWNLKDDCIPKELLEKVEYCVFKCNGLTKN